jgi:hypothetical protein
MDFADEDELDIKEGREDEPDIKEGREEDESDVRLV